MMCFRHRRSGPGTVLATARTPALPQITVLMLLGVVSVPGIVVQGGGQGVYAPPRALASQEVVSTYTPLQDTSRPRRNELPQVSLAVRDSSLAYILRALANQINLHLVYDAENSVFQRRISVAISKMEPMAAFASVLKGTGLAAAIAPSGDVLVVRPTGRKPDSTTGNITGRVIDSATRKWVQGATVTIQGVKGSVLTSEQGEYLIRDLPAGRQSVQVKVLYYKPMIRSVVVEPGKTVAAEFRLVATATMLSEVVTSATGDQRKREIGSAVTTINVDSVMRVSPVTSLTDLLETRVPGMTVQRSSGQPGDPSRLRLRGASSIHGSNDFVLIVDGIRVNNTYQGNQAPRDESAVRDAYAAPSPLDQIDPASIERIDVFKGPSASAMYGSDAANGVIVVTTRRGRAGPAQWNLKAESGISRIPGKFQDNIWRFGATSGGLGYGQCSFKDIGCEIDSIVSFQALNDPDFTPLGRGYASRGDASVGGGTSAIQYSLTAGASRTIGLFKMPNVIVAKFRDSLGRDPASWMRRPDQYTTWSGSAQLTSQVNPALNVTVISTLFKSEQQRSSLGEGVLRAIGTVYRDTSYNSSYNRFYEKATTASLTTNNLVKIGWQALSWLPLTLDAGVSSVETTGETLIPRGIDGDRSRNVDTAGKYGIARGQDQRYTINLLSGQIPIWKNQITTVVGVNYTSQSGSTLNGRAEEIPAGASLPTVGFEGVRLATQAQRTFGWYVQPQFNLHSRFFVVPGFRLDNNGLAGANARLMGLPKLEFSWVASEELFFPWKHLVQELRLRTAFGTAGVQPGPLDRLRTFVIDTGGQISIPEAYRGGIALSTVGNTELRPERSTEFVGGFDLSLWQGRLTTEFTGYRKTRYDAIERVLVAGSVFASSVNRNIGVVRNTGIEIGMNTVLLETRQVGWRVSGAMSRRRDVVTQLRESRFPIVSARTSGGIESRVVEGYPLFGIWARPILGWADANANSVIEATEVVIADSSVYLGNPEPSAELNFDSNLSLLSGRLTLNAGVAYTAVTQVYTVGGEPTGALQHAASDPNASEAEQAIISALNQTIYGMVQNTRTWRFQRFSMIWDAGPRLARRLGGRTVTFGLLGNNLGLKTNYKGKDPNVNSRPGSNINVDDGALPQPRTWTFRITLRH